MGIGIIGRTIVGGGYIFCFAVLGIGGYVIYQEDFAKKGKESSQLVQKTEISPLTNEVFQKMFPEDYNIPWDNFKKISRGDSFPQYKCFRAQYSKQSNKI